MDENEVLAEVHTVCHHCGGGGSVADPVHAVIGGEQRTVDNGRPCPLCSSAGHIVGLVPPV